MNEINENTPVLRFAEFLERGAWDSKYGNEVFKTISEKNKNYDLPILAITQEHGAIPRDLIDYHVIVSQKSISGYKLIEKGDFIISLRSFQGGIEYSEYKGLCSPAYIILRKSITANSIFFKSYLKTDRYIKLLNRNLEGLRDGKMISYKQFSEIPLPFPTLPEQQKIANCLSSLDEKINNESEQLTALETHKKGLTQQLFPAETKKIPPCRFPELEDSGEWKFKYGDEVFNTISEKNKNYDLPILAITQEHGAIPRDMIDYHVVVSKKSIASYKVVKKGDFMISLRSFQGGIEYSEYNGLCSPAYIILRKSITVNSTFFKHFLKTDRYIQLLNRNLEGLRDGKMISYKQFSEIKVPLPTLPEQQKIADCLSSLDDLITAQRDKIDALKLHKKGLMQGLFPSVA